MKIFTFNLLQLLQRTDESLRVEQGKTRPNPARLVRLQHKRHAIAARLGRTVAAPLLAAG